MSGGGRFSPAARRHSKIGSDEPGVPASTNLNEFMLIHDLAATLTTHALSDSILLRPIPSAKAGHQLPLLLLHQDTLSPLHSSSSRPGDRHRHFLNTQTPGQDAAPSTPNFLPIEFVIIGGSLCGLSAAIALARVGHKVTIFDVTNPFEPTPLDAGCRLPPNSTKIYYRWGLEERLRKCSVKSEGTMFASFESGSVVASHEWKEDVMQETGGDFLLIHYTDLRRTLADSAREHGAQFRHGPDAQIISIQPHPERPSVTLTTGEVVSADVVVGADGYITPGWLTRREIMEAIHQEDMFKPTGVAVYNSLIREADLDNLEGTELLEQIHRSNVVTQGKVFTWFGSSDYGAQLYPINAPTTGDPLVTMSVYVPHDFESDPKLQKGIYAYNPPIETLHGVLKIADPRLKQLAQQARSVACIPIFDRPSLKEWVHPKGRVICIGDAAHPTYRGSTYTFGLATGDAAVLGRLFRHLHRKEQIDSFLSAVQEIRQPRIEQVVKASLGNVFAVSLPPGVAQAHDRTLRERAEKGIKDLGRRQSHTSEEMVQVIENIFGYDPEDEADDWWVQWGLMQERAAHWTIVDSDQPLALVVEEEARQEG
ncbi:hypothetical protein C8Q74DRAFT_1367760 [Fomes fomentarius]|nr:hypothetical protein C8Q74DRAFT_1367760 [Fomes fomentarius]